MSISFQYFYIEGNRHGITTGYGSYPAIYNSIAFSEIEFYDSNNNKISVVAGTSIMNTPLTVATSNHLDEAKMFNDQTSDLTYFYSSTYNSKTYPPFVQFSFGSVKTVSKIRIYNYGGSNQPSPFISNALMTGYTDYNGLTDTSKRLWTGRFATFSTDFRFSSNSNIYWDFKFYPTLSNFPDLTKPYNGGTFTITKPNSDNTISPFTYSSSNTNVAIIVSSNSSGVTIQIKGSGSTVINASQPEYYSNATGSTGDNKAMNFFSGNSISCTLTVTPPPPPNLSNFIISTKTYASDSSFNLTPPNSTISGGTFVYEIISSSPSSIISISGSTVTILGAGTATIRATQQATLNNSSASIETTLTINKGIPLLTNFYSTGLTREYFLDLTFNLTRPTSTNLETTAFTYSSSNTGVATVNLSTGLVTIKSTGQTNITATQAETTNYTQQIISFTLDVKSYPTLSNFYSSNLTKTYSFDSSFNLIKPDSNSNGRFTYTSNNTSVALIAYDSNSGGAIVTMKSIGSTVIRATQDASGNYFSGYIETTLYIKGSPNLRNFYPSGISKPNILDSSFNLIRPDSDNTVTAFTYSILNTGVAIVDSNTGLVTIKSTGSTTITASQVETDIYSSGEISTTLRVKPFPTLTNFYSTGLTKPFILDSSFNLIAPTSTNSETTVFTYSSTNTGVATVDSSTGSVTIKGTGQTTIRATQAETTNYAEQSISFILSVKPLPTITFSDITEIYGNSDFSLNPISDNLVGTFSYSIVSSVPSGTITISGSNVTIVKAGTVTITATQQETTDYAEGTATATLTISKATPTITFNDITKSFDDIPFNLAATSTNLVGAFVYSVDSSTPSGIISISGSIVTILGAGTATIRATQQETDNYVGTYVTCTLSISKATTTLNGNTDGSAFLNDASISRTVAVPSITLTATSSRIGAFDLVCSSSDTSIAEIFGNMALGFSAIIKAIGTTTITIKQLETANYFEGLTKFNLTVTEKISTTFRYLYVEGGNSGYTDASDNYLNTNEIELYDSGNNKVPIDPTKATSKSVNIGGRIIAAGEGTGRWVAAGEGSANTLAWSNDGINWNGLGKTIFSDSGKGVVWNGSRWIAVGQGTNTLAHSIDGSSSWTGLGTTIFRSSGNGVASNGSMSVAVGTADFKITTGVSPTTFSTYTVYTFNSSGSITFNKDCSAQVLIVGGGGGGGNATPANNTEFTAGGGGAGGVGVGAINFKAGTYNITVGASGSGGGGNGGSSSISGTADDGTTISETANGGGGGSSSITTRGNNGGSGGGGAYKSTYSSLYGGSWNTNGSSTPGTATTGSGLLSYKGNSSSNGGGGSGDTQYSRNGYSWSLNNTTYAGGGGNGNYDGGTGGGGKGATNASSAISGTTNRGGGGGGGYSRNNSSYTSGASGGSGVVIIAVLTSVLIANPNSNTLAYSSNDTSWNSLNESTTLASPFRSQGNGVVWNGSIWVAVGQGKNSIAYSSDGTSWTGLGTSIFSTSGNGVAWNGSRLVAVGEGTNSIAYSSNGTSWTGLGLTTPTTPFTTRGNGVAWNGFMWVAVGEGTNSIAYSFDGSSNWIGLGLTSPASPFTGRGNGISWNGSFWLATGEGTNSIAYSYDGINWTGLGLSSPASPFSTRGNAVAWNAISSSICYSTDNGVNWTNATLSDGATKITPYIFKIATNENRIVAVSSYNFFYSDDNGTTWAVISSIPFERGRSIAYNGTRWVAVGSNKTSGTKYSIAYSNDGTTWTGVSNNVFDGSGGNDVAWNGTHFLAVGSGNTNNIAYSTDGTIWTATTKIGQTLLSVVYGNGKWIIGGDSALPLSYASSATSTTWTTCTLPSTTNEQPNTIWSIAWNGSKFIAVGITNNAYNSTTDKYYAVVSSTDGVTWTYGSSGNVYFGKGSAFRDGYGKYVTWNIYIGWVVSGRRPINSANSYGETIYTSFFSDNGTTWSELTNSKNYFTLVNTMLIDVKDNNPSFAVDNNTDTTKFFQSSGYSSVEGSREWLQIDMEGEKNISKIRIYNEYGTTSENNKRQHRLSNALLAGYTDSTGITDTTKRLWSGNFATISKTVNLTSSRYWEYRFPVITNFNNITKPNITNSTFTLSAPTSTSTGTFSYSSSNTNIATISTNTVTIKGTVGLAIITATQAQKLTTDKPSTDSDATSIHYFSGSITCTLIVKYKTIITNFGNITKTFGDIPFQLDPSSNNISPFNFKIGTNGVATLNTNIVSILKAGSIIIDVSQNETTDYAQETTSCTLTVNQAPTTITATQDGQPFANGANITRIYGNSPIVLVPSSNRIFNNPFVYDTFNNTIADFSGNTVRLKKGSNGNSVRITIRQTATADYYLEGSIFFNLTINKASSTVTCLADDVSIINNQMIARTYGDNNIVLNPSSDRIDTDLFYYDTSNNTIADFSGNIVRLKTGGTTLITVRQLATDNYNAASIAFYLTIGKAIPTLSFNDIVSTYAVDLSFNIIPTVNSSGGALSYTIDDQTIASINANKLTINKAGSTIIRAKLEATISYSEDYTKTFTLTINRAVPTINFKDIEKTYDANSLTINLTDTSFVPTSNSIGAFSYEIEDTNIATVDGNIVTIKKAGKTNIKVTQAETDKYLGGYYVIKKLTITKAIPAITFNNVEKTYDANSLTINLTDLSFNPTSNSDGNFTYEILNTDIATVLGNIVTIKIAGETKIKAIQEESTNYVSYSVEKILKINKAIPTINFGDVTKTYDANSLTINLTDASFNPSSNSDGAFIYEILDTNIATVAGNIVTIKKAGETTIKAIQVESTNYLTNFVIKKLIITKAIPTINFNDIEKTYDANSLTINLTDVSFNPTSNSNGNFTYEILNTNIATVSGNIITIKIAGETTIKAIQAESTNYFSYSVEKILKINKAIPTINFNNIEKTYDANSLTINLTDTSFVPTSNSIGAFSYEIEDTNIATVDGNTVTIKKAGATNIKVIQAETDKYLGGYYVIKQLTITKAIPTMTFNNVEKTYDANSLTIDLTDVSLKPNSNSDGAFRYEILNTDIATVLGNIVTIKIAGETKIKAIQEESTNYVSSSVEKTLKISKAIPTINFGDVTKTYDANSLTINLTDASFKPSSNSDGNFTYEILDTTIATVLGNIVTIKKAGETTIKTIQAESTNYLTNFVIKKLTINKAIPTITFNNIEKTYDANSLTIKLTDVSFNPTSNSDGAFSYEILNTNIATVSGNIVTIKIAGETTIKAIQAESTNYLGGYYEARVFKINKAVPTMSFANIEKTYGEIPFNLAPVSNSNGSFTYSITDGIIADISGSRVTIKSAGETTIKATQAETDKYLGGYFVINQFKVKKANTNITAFSNIARTFGTSPVILTEPISNRAGEFIYSSSDTAVATAVKNASGIGFTLTIIGGGIATITIKQNTNTNYLEGSTTFVFTVNRATTTVTGYADALTFRNIIRIYNSAPITLDASSNRVGDFIYTSSDASVATILNKVLTIKGGGTSTITVKQVQTTNYLEGSSSFILTIGRDVPVITEFNNISTTFAAFPITLRPKSNSKGAFSFMSDNVSVADISGNKVIIKQSGKAIITGLQAGTTDYEPKSFTCEINVNKTKSIITKYPDIQKTTNEQSFIITPPISTNLTGVFSYTSSNKLVADISGNVAIIKGVGETTIEAIQESTTNYLLGKIKYKLLVKTYPTLSFNNLTAKYSDNFFLLESNLLPTSDSNGNFSYKSLNTNIADISGNIVIIKGAGTTTITAIQEETPNYFGGDVSCTLTIDKSEPIINYPNLNIPFNTNPLPLVPISNSIGSFNITIDNQNLATIDGSSATGFSLTMKSIGEATITISQSESINHLFSSITRSIKINKAYPALSGFNNITKQYGLDLEFALTAPNSNSDGAFTYSISNTSIARIDNNMVTILGNGFAIITATQQETANYLQGTIRCSLIVNKKIITEEPVSIKTFNDKPNLNFFIGKNNVLMSNGLMRQRFKRFL